ncbi:MAG: FAD-binding oxidoreductase [Gammaproteobacteria bacterium]
MGINEKATVIIGAGMVGVSCALYLQRAGHRVTLVDAHAPGSQTSFGNAATFASYACIPVNHPKLLKSLPRLMTGDERPLSISPLYGIKMLPWLIQFLRHCSRARVDETIAGLGALLRESETAALDLFQDVGGSDLIRRDGTLYLYSTNAALSAAQADIRRRREQGVRITDLGPSDIQNLEPHLNSGFAGGILYDDGFHLLSPQTMITRMTEHFVANGGLWRNERIKSIDQQYADQVSVRGETQSFTTRQVVIAAGAWSTQIGGGLIDPLPLETERGYHVMFPNDAALLTRPVGLADAGLYISPLADGLRAAGTVELAGLSAPINQRRLQYIRRMVKRALPGSGESGSTWLGFRPTLPDSLPVIGRSTRHRSVIYAFGHQHVGITLGGITGKLVQQLIDHQRPQVDLAPYRPERFAR